jgi:hypothetical protein
LTNHKFNQKIRESGKSGLLEKANEADRRVHKLKRQAYKDFQTGKSEDEILADLARERIRCPLLTLRQPSAYLSLLWHTNRYWWYGSHLWKIRF